MRIKDFFDSEFIQFSNLDNVRSIPSVIDGFKDSQRKATYGMICHGQSEIKCAQAAGQFALITHYAHGETSMADTIVGLAQDYPGSNNVNLFEPIGQFGSILSSQSASHRYIYTKPSKYLREYIKKDDDCILEHRYEDGDKAEPLYFLPVLPMWIVNGSVGIGTGHSVKILPRNPKDILKAVKLMVKDTGSEQRIKKLLMPHFVGWKGTVEQGENENQFILTGILEKENTTTIRVSELPVGYGVDKFKTILVALMDKGKVKDFDNNSSENGFDFTIKVPRDVGKKSEADLISLFKLTTKMTENVTMWGTDFSLNQYGTVYDALRDFVQFRLGKYEERRLKHLEILENDNELLRNKQLFITLWNDLENPGKLKTDVIKKTMLSEGVLEKYFDSFMLLRINSLTMDKVDDLQKEIQRKDELIALLQKQTNIELYQNDLEEL